MVTGIFLSILCALCLAFGVCLGLLIHRSNFLIMKERIKTLEYLTCENCGQKFSSGPLHLCQSCVAQLGAERDTLAEAVNFQLRRNAVTLSQAESKIENRKFNTTTEKG